MREILFRGKCADSGEWIYGWYEMYPFERFPVRPCIIPSESAKSGYYEHVEVDPTTVGQYTGLTDKNGVKIFEGDIVSAKNNICGETYRFLVEFGVCGGVENVEHSVGFPCFFFKEVTGVIPSEYMMRKDPVYFLNAYKCEVIGNAHDNPELLK